MDECCVEYRIYIHDKIQTECNDYEKEYRSLLTKYLAYLSQFIKDYIWQNECFRLSFVPKHGSVIPHLCGQTYYGDNVEDEWFIVFLLFQLSLKYADISISVQDSDGDFLLIEAAHELPRWLNPETSENRIFIHGGKLHIIPLPSSPREITMFPTGIPSLECALNIVHGPYNTIADTKIQQAVSRRIDGYPEKAHQSYHHANCLVPPTVKYLLDYKPSLVSCAIPAFYHRDPLDMKVIKQAKFFPPTERILTRVRFTKCLYAQLMQQDFQSDKKSSWKIPSSDSSLYKAHQLGFKLTCGFEILCSKSNTINQSTKKPSGEEWQQFLEFLIKQGYFKGEIEDSKLYNNLLSKAEHYFKDSLSSIDETNPGNTILSLLNNAKIDFNQMKEQEQNLPPEDDDTWLDISATDLEAMLQAYSTTSSTAVKPPNNDSQKEDFNLESVTQTMKAFVDKVSSHEGAEFPGEEEEDEAIDFNADSFVDTMRQLLEGRTPALDSDEDDEYFSDVSDDDHDDDDDKESLKEKEKLLSYMDDLDRELAKSKIGESFEKIKSSGEESQNSSDQNENVSEEEQPVDIDLNLVKNMLESFSSQQGLAGPATNILNAMGMMIPRDENKLVTDTNE